ncbi:hypothetical protein PFICI_15148 [Pestalotiopsis fici W106-1]|uniref:Ecp2 effector protein domain-containing protein n=1 Tax=Pestalotiopsis fici (strain W106-1 / CGMCC3.15140) TaxID=1229662 RepID=W3WH33_PESFW|nr:uncharacterized protein PFICI_15148 [Pestalotiopsis fici W106-1]ETS73203.1 hypothetical protein PFICI_15148 [Pestalotiopsis fici W106-1]
MSFRNCLLLMGYLLPRIQAAPSSRHMLASDVLAPLARESTENLGISYCAKPEEAPIHTTGDPEVGPGFWITNNDGIKGDYFIYENSRDEHPWKYITIDAGVRSFVQVCSTFQGHIVRGAASINLDNSAHNLGTWAVANIDTTGAAWGAISFLQGSDGGGSVASTDGTRQTRECTVDVLDGAPDAALVAKGSGVKVLNKVVGDGASVEAMHWMLAKCRVDQIYIEEPGPNPVIKSGNGRLEFVFFKGRF